LNDLKTSIKEYWQDSWTKRIKDEHTIKLNLAKKDKIKQFLDGFHFNGLKKLDIGCGPCHHAIMQKWDNYTGVDYSEKALDFARKALPSARFYNMDILDIPEEKYDVFMAFDTLEHIDITDALVKKIRILSSESAVFIGNIPLTKFTIHDDNVEHLIDYNMLSDFLIRCGFPLIRTESFYTKGRTFNKSLVFLPFMLFFAEKHYGE
jgi:2-polyprenyl-3-methyl-5-hydroxy-6-metoxy-1,4-benzoquinol methylase